MRRLLLSLAALTALATLTATTTYALLRPTAADWRTALSRGCCIDIVHAAGRHDGAPYANNREALDAAVAAGRTLIELDFLETTDGHVVTLHDWARVGGAPLTLAETIAAAPGTPLDLPGLLAWLDGCPACRIVTDPKFDPARFLDRLRAATTPERLRDQFILQTYAPDEAVAVARRLPGQPLILTTYAHGPLSDAEARAVLALPDLVAVTMPLRTAFAHAGRLRRLDPDVVLLTHGPPARMADPKVLAAMRLRGIDGFYVTERP